MNKFYTRGAIALLIAVPLGCEQGPMESVDRTDVFSASGHIPTASPERVILCKDGPAGSTFDFTVTGSPLAVANPSVPSGTCQQVYFAGGDPVDLTITELAQAGFVLDSIVVDQYLAGVNTTTKYTGTDNVTVTAGGRLGGAGAVVVFYNSDEPTTGGEGCTPGYWKQPHHFDSWTGYDPDDLFSSVFDDAFPGMTLLEVASQGGGGLNALGRHAVAALLNAASGGVDYNLTTAEVIAAFNAAYASGDYEALKNILEGYNEQGCPLN